MTFQDAAQIVSPTEAHVVRRGQLAAIDWAREDFANAMTDQYTLANDDLARAEYRMMRAAQMLDDCIRNIRAEFDAMPVGQRDKPRFETKALRNLIASDVIGDDWLEPAAAGLFNALAEVL